MLDPGAASVGFAAAHFSGADLNENDVPIVEAALGIVTRVQVSLSVPRVVGDASATVSSGVGTTFLADKVGVLDDPKRHFKVAITPTLEILGSGIADSLPAGERRTQFGPPASVELDGGPMRLYAAGGFFASGVRFEGGGVASHLRRGRRVACPILCHAWVYALFMSALIGLPWPKKIAGKMSAIV